MRRKALARCSLSQQCADIIEKVVAVDLERNKREPDEIRFEKAAYESNRLAGACS